MDYLPIFEPEGVKLTGRADIRERPDLLAGRAVCLSQPGDSVTLRARGRHLGLVFAETDGGGIVEVTVLHKRYRVDLFSPDPRARVFELALPSRWVAVPVTVKMTDRHHPESRSSEAWLQGAYLADCHANQLADRIRARVEPDPYTGARINQLTDVFKWYDPDWVAAMAAFNATPPYTPPDFVHRKAWEWVQTIYGLDGLGMIRPNVRALGVGVGWEPLSFFFAHHVAEVVATDLYSVDSEWSGREGNPRILQDPKDFAPYPYPEDRVKFLRMDGTHLEFPDESFDLIWSCSSIEHFGRHEGASRAMREIERVLRPGGVASVITEYVLPDADTGELSTFDAEFFNLRCLHDYLLAPVPRLRLVQMLDLTLPDYYRRRAVIAPAEAEAPHGGVKKPHVVLHLSTGTEITSVALFLRKAGGRVPPAPVRRFAAAQAERAPAGGG
ncbi:MAG: class I SAM-dependent methyltransferase [Actinomycetota bacterium]|nr:class I SAM-dependent methyltransferase [Actinomycetota bacterium]